MFWLIPAQSPSNPYRKGSTAQKAETRDAGPCDPAAGFHPGSRPFSFRPGMSGSAPYKMFAVKGKHIGGFSPAGINIGASFPEPGCEPRSCGQPGAHGFPRRQRRLPA